MVAGHLRTRTPILVADTPPSAAGFFWGVPPADLSSTVSNRLQPIRRTLTRATVPNDFVAELLTLAQIRHAGTFDRADMNEDVSATVVGLNEKSCRLSSSLTRAIYFLKSSGALLAPEIFPAWRSLLTLRLYGRRSRAAQIGGMAASRGRAGRVGLDCVARSVFKNTPT
jgi:hypothetical protein